MRKIWRESEDGPVLLEAFRDNITQLQGVFERGNTLYLLLPWADRGSLHDVLGEGPTPEWSLRLFKEQVSALVGALALLHMINCRHGDLKPNNILIFNNDRGEMQFRIADFGLATVHEHATSARDQSTTPMTGAQRYEPPEVSRNHEGRNEAWSRKYDIWSLGCILLEFIICARDGAESLKKFNEELGPRRVETFWKRGSDGRFQVHPVVVDRIERMKKDLSRNTNSIQNQTNATQSQTDLHQDQGYFKELLTKVETRMLVIETTSKGGTTETCRATALVLFAEMVRDGMTAEWSSKMRRLHWFLKDRTDSEIAGFLQNMSKNEHLSWHERRALRIQELQAQSRLSPFGLSELFAFTGWGGV